MTALLSRRSFLQSSPSVAVAIGASASTLAVETHSAPAETSEETIARLTRELALALQKSAQWSEWTDWLELSDSKAGVVQLIARRKTVAFSGAGHYVVLNGNREGVFWIERDAAKDHATTGRCFRMTPRDKAERPVWMFDDHLKTMLVEKIGAIA